MVLLYCISIAIAARRNLAIFCTWFTIMIDDKIDICIHAFKFGFWCFHKMNTYTTFVLLYIAHFFWLIIHPLSNVIKRGSKPYRALLLVLGITYSVCVLLFIPSTRVQSNWCIPTELEFAVFQYVWLFFFSLFMSWSA